VEHFWIKNKGRTPAYTPATGGGNQMNIHEGVSRVAGRSVGSAVRSDRVRSSEPTTRTALRTRENATGWARTRSPGSRRPSGWRADDSPP